MSHYETLGVDKSATAQMIKTAYRALAAMHHPDREQGDAERMSAINKAYEVLSDPKKREHYDATGTDDATSPTDNSVRATLAHMFEQVIEAVNVNDPLKAVRGALENALTHNRQRIEDLSRRVVRLHSRRDKLRTKNGVNLYLELIDARCSRMDEDIQQMTKEGKVMEAALKQLEDYEFTGDTAPSEKPPYSMSQVGTQLYFQNVRAG